MIAAFGESATSTGRSGKYGARRVSAVAGTRGATPQQQGAARRVPASSAWQWTIDISGIPGIAAIEVPAGLDSQMQPMPNEASRPARARRVEIPRKRERNRTGEVFHGAA
ncbi:MAG TPA: hypothetical protein VN851_28145 [Thermoanaerobaculia bacterium]|nr:hypothetical protein [Thermoanaerobaculia bacterium]